MNDYKERGGSTFYSSREPFVRLTLAPSEPTIITNSLIHPSNSLLKLVFQIESSGGIEWNTRSGVFPCPLQHTVLRPFRLR